MQVAPGRFMLDLAIDNEDAARDDDRAACEDPAIRHFVP